MSLLLENKSAYCCEWIIFSVRRLNPSNFAFHNFSYDDGISFVFDRNIFQVNVPIVEIFWTCIFHGIDFSFSLHFINGFCSNRSRKIELMGGLVSLIIHL